MRRVIDEVMLTSARKLGRSWSKLRGEVRSVKDFDPLVLVFYFMGAVVGLLLWRLVRMWL